jgi:hypothetical protein
VGKYASNRKINNEEVEINRCIGGFMFEPCIQVKNIMNKFGYPWFIVGGWAIDLFLEKETRTHEHIEIGIYREQQMQLFRYLGKYKKYYNDNRSRIGKYEKKEWKKEYLRLPIHELYIEYEGFEIEILLNDKDDAEWIYGRNCKIKHEMNNLVRYTDSRVPYLCPEIVLLCKTEGMRKKDKDDISNALEKMSESEKKWFIDSIEDKTAKDEIKSLVRASSL